MAKPSYYEQLKHPEWQKMRLRVLERENFTCQSCGSAEKTLHVHHTFYKKGAAPWEYPEASLQCLCEDCHKEAGELAATIARLLAAIAPHSAFQMHAIGYLLALQAEGAVQDDPRAEPSGIYTADYETLLHGGPR